MPRERRRRAGTEISRDREATRLHSPLETPFTEEEAAREAARPRRSHSGQIAVSDPVIPGASLDPLGQHPGAWGPLDRSGEASPSQTRLLAGIQVQGRRRPGPAFGSANATGPAPSRTESPAPVRMTTPCPQPPPAVGVFHAPPRPPKG